MLQLNQLVKVEPSVRCSACGQSHNLNAATFISIIGDLRIGSDFDLFASNVDANGVVNNATILCRNEKCTQPLLEAMTSADPDFEKIASRVRDWRSSFNPEKIDTQMKITPEMLTPMSVVNPGMPNSMVPHD